MIFSLISAAISSKRSHPQATLLRESIARPGNGSALRSTPLIPISNKRSPRCSVVDAAVSCCSTKPTCSRAGSTSLPSPQASVCRASSCFQAARRRCRLWRSCLPSSSTSRVRFACLMRSTRPSTRLTSAVSLKCYAACSRTPSSFW